MRNVFGRPEKAGRRSRAVQRGICQAAAPKAADASVEPGQAALDRARALRSVGGDEEYLMEVAGIVQAALPNLLCGLQQAVAGGDLRAALRNAHLLTAAAFSVSAERARAAALLLETAALRGDGSALPGHAAALEAEIAKLAPALAELERSFSPGTSSGDSHELC